MKFASTVSIGVILCVLVRPSSALAELTNVRVTSWGSRHTRRQIAGLHVAPRTEQPVYRGRAGMNVANR